MFQLIGLPDLIGCVEGLFLGIEAKIPDKKSKLKAHQWKVLVRIIRKGKGFSLTTRSVEHCINSVGEYLYEKKITQEKIIYLPETSYEFRIKKKKKRVIHGAGDWEDYCIPSANKSDSSIQKAKISTNRLS